MKLLVLYNPHAGNDRAKKILPDVISYFQEKEIDAEIIQTKYRHQGMEIVKDAEFANYDGLIAAGGDGTLFEVINGYYRNTGEKRIPIGILPVGTGNAFARDLDLKTNDYKTAIDLIAQNKPRGVDVGKFSTEGKEYYFLNILGLGFVSDVVVTANKLKFLGNVAYLLGVFHQIIFLKSHGLEIKCDDELIEQQNIFVEVSNTTYTSNFYMAPNAKIDDGLLDITLLCKTNRRKLLKALPTVFTGEHIHLDIVKTIQAKKIEIKTDSQKILTPDGEMFGTTPVTIECLHQDVEVFGN